MFKKFKKVALAIQTYTNTAEASLRIPRVLRHLPSDTIYLSLYRQKWSQHLHDGQALDNWHVKNTHEIFNAFPNEFILHKTSP